MEEAERHPDYEDHHGQQQRPNARSWKLMIDPYLKKGLSKLYRVDGHAQNPTFDVTEVTDPRTRMPRFLARSDYADLPVPCFKIDDTWVGPLPEREVSFLDLNDNVDNTFLSGLCRKCGEVDEVTIMYHPEKKRHLGLAHVVFKTEKGAKSCMEKYDGQSVMGQTVRVIKDIRGREIRFLFDEAVNNPSKSGMHGSTRFPPSFIPPPLQAHPAQLPIPPARQEPPPSSMPPPPQQQMHHRHPPPEDQHHPEHFDPPPQLDLHPPRHGHPMHGVDQQEPGEQPLPSPAGLHHQPVPSPAISAPPMDWGDVPPGPQPHHGAPVPHVAAEPPSQMSMPPQSQHPPPGHPHMGAPGMGLPMPQPGQPPIFFPPRQFSPPPANEHILPPVPAVYPHPMAPQQNQLAPPPPHPPHNAWNPPQQMPPGPGGPPPAFMPPPPGIPGNPPPLPNWTPNMPGTPTNNAMIPPLMSNNQDPPPQGMFNFPPGHQQQPAAASSGDPRQFRGGKPFQNNNDYQPSGNRWENRSYSNDYQEQGYNQDNSFNNNWDSKNNRGFRGRGRFNDGGGGRGNRRGNNRFPRDRGGFRGGQGRENRYNSWSEDSSYQDNSDSSGGLGGGYRPRGGRGGFRGRGEFNSRGSWQTDGADRSNRSRDRYADDDDSSGQRDGNPYDEMRKIMQAMMPGAETTSEMTNNAVTPAEGAGNSRWDEDDEQPSHADNQRSRNNNWSSDERKREGHDPYGGLRKMVSSYTHGSETTSETGSQSQPPSSYTYVAPPGRPSFDAQKQDGGSGAPKPRGGWDSSDEEAPQKGEDEGYAAVRRQMERLSAAEKNPELRGSDLPNGPPPPDPIQPPRQEAHLPFHRQQQHDQPRFAAGDSGQHQGPRYEPVGSPPSDDGGGGGWSDSDGEAAPAPSGHESQESGSRTAQNREYTESQAQSSHTPDQDYPMHSSAEQRTTSSAVVPVSAAQTADTGGGGGWSDSDGEPVLTEASLNPQKKKKGGTQSQVPPPRREMFNYEERPPPVAVKHQPRSWSSDEEAPPIAAPRIPAPERDPDIEEIPGGEDRYQNRDPANYGQWSRGRPHAQQPYLPRGGRGHQNFEENGDLGEVGPPPRRDWRAGYAPPSRGYGRGYNPGGPSYDRGRYDDAGDDQSFYSGDRRPARGSYQSGGYAAQNRGGYGNRPRGGSGNFYRDYDDPVVDPAYGYEQQRPRRTSVRYDDYNDTPPEYDPAPEPRQPAYGMSHRAAYDRYDTPEPPSVPAYQKSDAQRPVEPYAQPGGFSQQPRTRSSGWSSGEEMTGGQQYLSKPAYQAPVNAPRGISPAGSGNHLQPLMRGAGFGTKSPLEISEEEVEDAKRTKHGSSRKKKKKYKKERKARKHKKDKPKKPPPPEQLEEGELPTSSEPSNPASEATSSSTEDSPPKPAHRSKRSSGKKPKKRSHGSEVLRSPVPGHELLMQNPESARQLLPLIAGRCYIDEPVRKSRSSSGRSSPTPSSSGDEDTKNMVRQVLTEKKRLKAAGEHTSPIKAAVAAGLAVPPTAGKARHSSGSSDDPENAHLSTKGPQEMEKTMSGDLRALPVEQVSRSPSPEIQNPEAENVMSGDGSPGEISSDEEPSRPALDSRLKAIFEGCSTDAAPETDHVETDTGSAPELGQNSAAKSAHGPAANKEKRSSSRADDAMAISSGSESESPDMRNVLTAVEREQSMKMMQTVLKNIGNLFAAGAPGTPGNPPFGQTPVGRLQPPPVPLFGNHPHSLRPPTLVGNGIQALGLGPRPLPNFFGDPYPESAFVMPQEPRVTRDGVSRLAMDQFITDLKSVLEKDLRKKMFNLAALPCVEKWRTDLSAPTRAPLMPVKPQDSLANATSATEVKQTSEAVESKPKDDLNAANLPSGAAAKPPSSGDGILARLFNPDFHPGLRAAIPKLPSFKKKTVARLSPSKPRPDEAGLPDENRSLTATPRPSSEAAATSAVDRAAEESSSSSYSSESEETTPQVKRKDVKGKQSPLKTVTQKTEPSKLAKRLAAAAAKKEKQPRKPLVDQPVRSEVDEESEKSEPEDEVESAETSTVEETSEEEEETEESAESTPRGGSPDEKMDTSEPPVKSEGPLVLREKDLNRDEQLQKVVEAVEAAPMRKSPIADSAVMRLTGNYNPWLYDHCYVRPLSTKKMAARRAVISRRTFEPRKPDAEGDILHLYRRLLVYPDQEDITYLKRSFQRLSEEMKPQSTLENEQPESAGAGGRRTHDSKLRRWWSAAWSDRHINTLLVALGAAATAAADDVTPSYAASDGQCARSRVYKRLSRNEKLKSLRAGASGLARTRQVESFEDNRDRPSRTAVSRAQGDSSRNRQARLVQRRYLSEFANMDSDLISFNTLKVRRKSIKFRRSPIHNWGLFTCEKIGQDEMIVEYVGEKIRLTLAERREIKYNAMGIGSSYLFRMDSDWVIDATASGNLGRFINHSCNVSCPLLCSTLPRVFGVKYNPWGSGPATSSA